MGGEEQEEEEEEAQASKILFCARSSHLETWTLLLTTKKIT